MANLESLNPRDFHQHIFHNMICQHFWTTTVAKPQRQPKGNEAVMAKGRQVPLISSCGCQVTGSTNVATYRAASK